MLSRCAVLLCLCLVVTPVCADINQAASVHEAGVKLEWQQPHVAVAAPAVEPSTTAINEIATKSEAQSNQLVETSATEVETPPSDMPMPFAHLLLSLGADNNATNSSSIFGNVTTSLSLSDLNFVGNVLSIRDLILTANIMHTDMSKLSVQILTAVAMAFVAAMLLFAFGSLWSLFRAFQTSRSSSPEHAKASGFWQSVVTALFMVPYSAYYVMVTLMLAGVVVTVVMMMNRVAAVQNSTQVQTEVNQFVKALTSAITFFGDSIKFYLTDKLPTAEQLQRLGVQVNRLVTATVAVAQLMMQADAEFGSWQQKAPIPSPAPKVLIL